MPLQLLNKETEEDESILCLIACYKRFALIIKLALKYYRELNYNKEFKRSYNLIKYEKTYLKL
jgi:hypothetical protein